MTAVPLAAPTLTAQAAARADSSGLGIDAIGRQVAPRLWPRPAADPASAA